MDVRHGQDVQLHRQKVLDECKWTPGEGQLRYIKARTFANTSNLTELSI